jgi:alpha-ribazole phosphatase
MEIYLIRHTAPDIVPGLCYGHLDVGLKATFKEEALIIKNVVTDLPIEKVYSSDLTRCKQLANYLFNNDIDIEFTQAIREINCGDWEGQLWNDIPSDELNYWMHNFVEVPTKNGESYLDLAKRIIQFWEHTLSQKQNVAWVVHGGVIRTVLAHITNTSLQDSFKVFNAYYGAVVKINVANEISYEFLSNIPPLVKEQHKPSN